MYVYMDESGNTGRNINDISQPFLTAGVMVGHTNFDVLYGAEVAKAANKVGASVLHAKEMGEGLIDRIALELLSIIKRSGVTFSFSIVDKRYLAVARIYDAYFINFSNPGLPPHFLENEFTRVSFLLILMEKVFTPEIIDLVWSCITAPNEKLAKKLYIEAADAMIERTGRIPIERPRNFARDAFMIAKSAADDLVLHISDKHDRNVHSANVQAFTSALVWINKIYLARKAKNCTIIHDRQAQFGEALRRCHDELKVTPGSTFTIKDKADSPGLQIADTILWLQHRDKDGRSWDESTQRLMNRVKQRTEIIDFTAEGVKKRLIAKIEEGMKNGSFIVDPEKIPGDLAASEDRRRVAMASFLAGIQR